MNSLIPLMGNTPDIAGSFARGQGLRQDQIERERTNALAAMLQEQGPQIMAGDTNALGALAGYDPQMAVGIQSQQLGQQATRQGMQIDQQRLKLAMEAGQRAAAEHSANMSALERKQAAQETEVLVQQLARAWQAGPEEYTRVAPSLFGQAGVEGGQVPSYEDAPYLMMNLGATAEAFKTEGPTWRPLTPGEASTYGVAAGQIDTKTGKVQPINPPSGMTVFGPDGNPIVQTGAAQKPFTEGQSRGIIYATRAKGALPTLDAFGDALTSFSQTAAGAVPMNLGRLAQTPEYQQAQQAGDEFLQAVLRKDTGAAITPAEMAEYGRTYLPQPGDTPEVLAQKKDARARAVQAMENGMSAQEIIASERGMVKPVASGDMPQSAVDAGIDPDLWQYMTPEDRALWN